jgi:hypothetical protein
MDTHVVYVTQIKTFKPIAMLLDELPSPVLAKQARQPNDLLCQVMDNLACMCIYMPSKCFLLVN